MGLAKIKLLLGITLLILLVYGCTKDKQGCKKLKCEEEHTGNILFTPPYKGLYRVTVLDDSNKTVKDAYIDSEYTSGVLDSIFSQEVEPKCYHILFYYWVATGGVPDSTFYVSNVCVTECDTFKVNI